MDRKIMEKLVMWKEKKYKSPLLLLGARQVGKTFILEKFARENYEYVVYINFENHPNKKRIFHKDLDPKRIIEEIKLDISKKSYLNRRSLFLMKYNKPQRRLQL